MKFVFRAVRMLFIVLWDALREWRMLLVATWRLEHLGDMKGITFDDWLDGMDADAEKPKVGDTVEFWCKMLGEVVSADGKYYNVAPTCVSELERFRAYELEIVE